MSLSCAFISIGNIYRILAQRTRFCLSSGTNGENIGRVSLSPQFCLHCDEGFPEVSAALLQCWIRGAALLGLPTENGASGTKGLMQGHTTKRGQV